MLQLLSIVLLRAEIWFKISMLCSLNQESKIKVHNPVITIMQLQYINDALL